MERSPLIITESEVESVALSWLGSLGYAAIYGPEIAPGEPASERSSFHDVLLSRRVHEALQRLNPAIPADALDEAFRKVARPESPSLIANNRAFHRMLIDGIAVEYRRKDGSIAGDHARLVDFERPENNEFLAVNQFTVIEGQNRRPDIVVFINGLPLAVIELKNPADEDATIQTAFQQLQTYKNDIPSLFAYNEMLAISDGLEARAGTLTSDWSRFMPWRTIEGDRIEPKGRPELDVLIKGVFEKGRFLDLIRHFIVFEADGEKIAKKMAAYHQFHAVNKAVECTVEACRPEGDRKAGVIWHTQGSGKSLSMAFYAGKIIDHPAMQNPTLVVLNDRNDLDDQLFDTFAACQDLLRQAPVQAGDREDLKSLLSVASGGVVFTTIQKFSPEDDKEKYPLLSDRRNIVFIADEAHRSQYGFKAHTVKRKEGAYIAYGFAKYLRDALPNASFIGFTGTPIEKTDKSTPAVFGDYIDIYDIQRAVEDGATVRIYYEARLAKLDLSEAERPKLDPGFEEITEGEEEYMKERLKSRWARLEAVAGADRRVSLIAGDIVDHFEKRLEAIDGKGMIVCMSRRICAQLYDEIIKLRPEWHDSDDEAGSIKVVITGSASDKENLQPHIRNKKRRKGLADRFKDPNDPLKLVIVRDMWLTGFDAPCLHTMYIDKFMQGHGLMQAIARVNRVFRDKPGGLIVDYLGIAESLKRALADYTEGDRGETGIPEEEVLALMLEKYEVVQAMFYGFDCSRFLQGTPEERLASIAEAMEHILSLEDGKNRYLQAVAELSKAYAIVVTNDLAQEIREKVAFYQAVRSGLSKATSPSGKTKDDLDAAIRQIVSRAIVPDGIVDIYKAAGIKTPDISILSEEFLEEVRGLPHRNLALELLKKLLNDEIKAVSQRNLVQSRSFARMLDQSINKYHNRSIEAAQVIEELIDLAKEMREAHRRGADLGMTDEELAFYDALAVNDSAVNVLGDETLRQIAKELVVAVRKNATIDWAVKESARAKLRVIVRRRLRKYGYPPDKQETAAQTVLEQAELLCKGWAC
ncbi:MAG: type I restriction endonuclease subunit R [Methanotrichaceae archaeon]|nr:type I restriction endonuclease subunit R [Methanotrichaceae archaeon]